MVTGHSEIKSSPRACYAHSLPGAESVAEWETVEQHLKAVADGVHGHFPGAAGLAEAFDGSSWARVAALWHDLGKYCDAFQDYLLASTPTEAAQAHVEHDNEEDKGQSERRSSRRVDHSTFGAKHAIAKGAAGWLLAYPIAGHHGGLPNCLDLERRRAKEGIVAPYAPPELLDISLPALDLHRLRGADNRETAFRLSFFTRFIFSCLVDADFRATEWFMNRQRYSERTSHAPPPMTELRRSLNMYLQRFGAVEVPAPVDRFRSQVLHACRERAADSQGFFSLTVPTGGGKTLSSLAFALEHAVAHGLRRVIYAIPFTSIIEQNADVFREALAACGPLAMIEHHTTFEPATEDRWSRLAAENWDAPVILTTNVQLFESLFASKPAKCRKLHSIARSVIILDEAQTIPVTLLAPTLAAMRELVRNYRCTIVLCTATQPALVVRDGFKIGLPEPREIVPDVPGLFAAMQRVNVEPTRRISDDALVGELASIEQVLCIVHTKKAAAKIWRALAERTNAASCVHLSTFMCAEHRSERIREIRRRLGAGQPCRVISTSLIEAGVDVDFPVVYRAFAGFDAVAQAAGRCNRNGRLPTPGRVVVFETDDEPMFLKETVRSARAVARRFVNPIDPEAIKAYFEEHYWSHSDQWDERRILEFFAIERRQDGPFLFDFAKAAEAYRLIDAAQHAVVVPWGDQGRRLVDQLSALTEPATLSLRRRAQRFTVNLFEHEYRKLWDAGALASPALAGGMAYLVSQGRYDSNLGVDPDHAIDAAALMP